MTAARVLAAKVGTVAFLLALVFVFAASSQVIAQTITAPDITSEGPFLVDEGETAVATLTADDSDTNAGDLIWSKTGGADSAKFSLTSAGVLTFNAAKDYEAPDAAAADGTYEVTVQVSDGSETDAADLVVTLENVVELTTLTGPSTVDYEENRAVRVATYSASSEADRDGLSWSLSGADADSFHIDEPGGVLRFDLAVVSPNLFSPQPDYDAPADADSDGTYEVTVEVGDGVTRHSLAVEVTITDQDEAGTLTLSTTRPQFGVALTTTLTDPDGVTGTATYRWERSAGRSAWTDILGATASSYTPTGGETGHFLRVTATYTDGHGSGKTATARTSEVVTADLLSGLTVSTTDSAANSGHALRPSFDASVLHYSIGCAAAGETMTLTPTAGSGVRLSIDGTQVSSGESRTVDVDADSEVRVTLAGASGAATTYFVRCLSGDLLDMTVTTASGATGVIEDLIMFGVAKEAERSIAIVDSNGAVRFHRMDANWSGGYVRAAWVSAAGAYRYAYYKAGAGKDWKILDQNLEVIASVATVAPLTDTNRHDITLLDDGNYIVMAYEPVDRDLSGLTFGTFSTSQRVRDSAIQIRTPDGTPLLTWSSHDAIPFEDCTPKFPPEEADYAHVNTLQMVDGHIVASFRGCNSVLRIDPDDASSHKVVWRLGLTNLSDEEWEQRDMGPAPLEIIGDAEGQFCGQHGSSLLPNGHLILFDNGVLCMLDPWLDTQLLARPGGQYSRAVEYALDVDNGEAVFLRDHSLGGRRSKAGLLHGHVEELPNGDWLIGWGEHGASRPTESVTQVDPDTGEEKFSIALLQADGGSESIRPILLPPAALADDPVPLRAEFLDSGTSSFHAQGGPRPTVVIAFNQPVGDFENDTPSLGVQGATVDSVDPYFVSGEPAHAYRITLIPDSAASISISLLAGQNCADSGICTADGATLAETPAARTIYPAVTASFGQATYAAPEGGSIQIALMLSSDPERTIEIPLTFTEQGGASSADYSDVPNPTIIAGETEASFTFSATQDTIDDDGEKVKLGFGALPAGMTASGTTEATVSITDDDASPELILAASPAEIVEAGGSAMVTVEITNGVTFAEDQEIALSFAGTATKGTDYTVALESLTLTAGQSSVATTVTAVQDRVDDDAETILITASHGGGTIGAEQTITIIDDDATTCSEGMAGTYPCSNVDLMSFLALADIGGGEANDIWGWTDSSTGKEYAIMGRTTGTSFVDISDPVNPIYLGNLPPHSDDSTWRDVKVYADHAFIVTEANNSGMQVFDLTQLRMVASPPATFSETAHYLHFSDAHNLAINEDSGFAYAVGTNNCSGGLHMINIQTPTNPASAGCFSGDGYTHDAQCVNYDGPDLDHQGKEICFNSNEDTLTIVDVTNKAAPVMLSRTGYSGSRYTHQGWLTEDQVYFLLGDELDEKNNPDVTNTRTYMWDVSDLDDPALIGSHDATTTAIDHNQYVKGNYTYQSNYQAGLRILDITDIANGNLSEAAFFDVNPGSDPTNIEGGTWSNYPFFDSGIVIVSVIEQGLFILRPNLVDGVKPALASAAVNGAALTLTYGEVLDGNSTPATDAFTVTVAGSGRMVTHVSVSGRVVTLTLASAVAHGEAVTVSYSPGTNPIQDAVGNDALGLSNDPVRNDTPDTTAPAVSSLAISSNPGSDQTYAAGEEIEVTVTFSETVEVTGTPQLSLELGGGSRTAGYDSGTGTAALVFAYKVGRRGKRHGWSGRRGRQPVGDHPGRSPQQCGAGP